MHLLRAPSLRIIQTLQILSATFFLEKENYRILERMVGTYTPSIAPLEAPVSDCGMGLGGVEEGGGGRQAGAAPFQNYSDPEAHQTWS